MMSKRCQGTSHFFTSQQVSRSEPFRVSAPGWREARHINFKDCLVPITIWSRAHWSPGTKCRLKNYSFSSVRTAYVLLFISHCLGSLEQSFQHIFVQHYKNITQHVVKPMATDDNVMTPMTSCGETDDNFVKGNIPPSPTPPLPF